MIGGRDSRREAAQSSGYEPEPDDDDAAANEQLATAERVGRRQKRKSGSVASSAGCAAADEASVRYFSQTETWLTLSDVNGALDQSAQRSRRRSPAAAPMTSSSPGHT